jgi:hypothetical protein
MSISYQEQAELTCPSCGVGFAAAIWLILDAQEQPAAVDQLRQGALNLVTCPHCGNSGPAGTPLLFHDAQARRVIFAGAPGAAEHEVRDRARDLHALLVGSIPEEQRRPYLADVDIAQDLAGVAHMLQRMERRRAGAPPPAVETPRRGVSTGDETPPLLLAVQALLLADSPADLDRALAEHPLLLAPTTNLALAQLADVAVEQRAHEIAESLQQARRRLAQIGSAGSLSPATEPAPDLPEQALAALMRAQSADELMEAVGLHPLLLRPEVDTLLAEQIDQALDEGHDRLASAIEERREALAELRTARAAEAAATDTPPDPTEPTVEEAIEALLVADGEEAIAEALDRYPLLLDDVAAQALWQFASEARASGDEELARYAIECRDMLRRIREGLEQ